jgi:adenine-specific DNA-methyltransferase
LKNSNYSDWSKEDLVKEIKKLKKRKKYGIVWDEEKTKEKFDNESEGKLPILKEVKCKEIQTNDNSPTNILIEGDNYHSLSVLNYTHTKKVDAIYIDPPYNTGREFRYNDKMINLEDGYHHSKWLSFMKKRLELAKRLLKKSGVIFISIDDNEVAQLKLLCSEIFGEDNFVATFVWKRRSGANDPKNFVSNDHEYLICYRKSEDMILQGVKKDYSKYKNPDNDPRGPWMPDNLTVGKTKDERPNLFYEFKDPKTNKIYKAKTNRVWVFGEKRMLEEIKDGKIIFPKKDGGMPQYKRFKSINRSIYKPLSTWIEASVKSKKEIQNDKEEFDINIMQSSLNAEGTKELREILQKQSFNYPKPTRLIKEIVSYALDKNGIILDFFAGSGTTGQAVLELNKDDGGNRKFILCTNNEANISTDVCYPRIKNVIHGYDNLKNEKVKGLGGNLKYFKTDFVDGEPTDKNKKKLVEQCTEMLCLGEDYFNELKQTKTYSMFKNHEEKYLGIIYDDEGIEPLKKQIKSLGKKFNLYVFSLDENAREEEFEDVKNMVELKPIPEAILNVYGRIFR